MKKKLLLIVALVIVFTLALAACESTSYSVTFDFRNGTDPQTVKFSEYVEPTGFTNGKKVFGGWFTDEACTAGHEWEKPETLTADVTVYAKWIEYKVIFDAQNGKDPIEVVFDDNFKMPTTPTNGRLGFGGWYTDAACTEGKEWTKPETLTADVTVYAKWVTVYYVSFDFQNGQKPMEVVFDSQFEMPEIPENGKKVFVGWFTDAACTEGHEWEKPATLTADVTVYAKWIETWVTFDPQNGEEPVKVKFDEKFAMPEPPTKEEMKFGGWYTDAACTAGKEWTRPKMLTSDITVYARWITLYYVTIDLQNGESTTKVRYDDDFVLPTSPKNGEKVLLGWYTDAACTVGKEWTNPAELSADATIYAKWSDKFYVTFDPQTDAEAQKVLFCYGMEFPIYSNGMKTFGGWFTDAACTEGKEWTKPAELTSDITVYAKWYDAVVTFDPQNGDEKFSLTFNKDFKMPSDPQNGIKIFGGWYRDKECSPEKEWVVPGVLPCDITLYAKWIPVYFVTIDLQNGQDATKVKFDENFELPKNPTNGDKVFLGWFTDIYCSEGNEWTNPTELSADTTVYAKWSGKFYVTFEPQTGAKAEKVLFSYDMELPTFTNPKKSLGGWYTDPACTRGNEWTVPFELNKDITVYARWKTHVHDYGDSYMEFVECSDPDCYNTGRKMSTNEYKKLFVYDFNAEKQEEIDAMYERLLAMLDKPLLPYYYDFEDLFVQYDNSLSYVIEQYQYAYVFYKTYTDSHYKEDFDFVSNYRNEAITKYYSLFRKVYESDYRTFFFDGWDAEEIEQLLITADSYGDPAYLEIQNKVDALLLEYDELIANEASDEEISEKYGELVVLNNQLAQHFGYANYMDYAYEIQYERYYSPSSVATMRNYVKQYMVPVLNKLMEFFDEFQFTNPNADYNFYVSLSGASVFKSTADSKLAVNYMVDYFKQLKSDEFENEIDYFKYANELYKRGNYYTGRDEGAFSYWISAQQTSILFFGDVKDDYGSYNYQNAFTFVHEFGHYYNGVYNKGLSLSMDHDETQSQGDEMLFLAWLASHCADNEKIGYNALMHEQLANALYTICLATAVDEFEQAAYTGSYNGQPLPKRPNSDQVDYVALFKNVLGGYGKNVSDQGSYWTYVVFDQAGYYISYAMSALPSVEIFVNAMENFDSAKTSYMKLYAFSDNPEFVQVDEDGSRTLVADYSQILHYCGLQDPFEEGLYTTISNYFLAD